MIYPNGKRHKYFGDGAMEVPGVTTILAVAAKPQLIPWANKLGLNGTSVQDYNKSVAGIGTLVHAFIEGYHTGQDVDTAGFTEEQKIFASQCFRKYMDWYGTHTIKSIASERSLACLDYGGTMDAILEIDGVKTVVDYKTSKDVYPEYFAQLSAYYHLLPEDEAGEIRQVAVLQLPKESANFQYVVLEVDSDRFRAATRFFDACLELYKAQRALGT